MIELAEDQHAIRKLLPKLELVAFIANGSVLPRESGVSQRPMRGATPFHSPASMESRSRFPTGKHHRHGNPPRHNADHRRRISRKIHTPESAGARVYNHIAGDGRNLLSQMKLRSKSVPRTEEVSAAQISPCSSITCQIKRTPAVSVQRMPAAVPRRLQASSKQSRRVLLCCSSTRTRVQLTS